MNLADYSAIVISISGGKDSQTILGVVMGMAREQGYTGQISAVHANTGAEWPQSLPHCRMLCDHYGIRLDVAVPHRALPAHIERRQRWPSAACRYCTSDCKRNPIQKVVRVAFPAGGGANILSVTGERRQESAHRAKLPEIDGNKPLTVGGRKVTNWRPILDYRLEDVWTHISATGLPRHVAYERGNERLSCAICVLAKESDIRNGAAECPELAEHYLRIERETGHTFKNGKSLLSILTRGGCWLPAQTHNLSDAGSIPAPATNYPVPGVVTPPSSPSIATPGTLQSTSNREI